MRLRKTGLQYYSVSGIESKFADDSVRLVEFRDNHFFVLLEGQQVGEIHLQPNGWKAIFNGQEIGKQLSSRTKALRLVLEKC